MVPSKPNEPCRESFYIPTEILQRVASRSCDPWIPSSTIILSLSLSLLLLHFNVASRCLLSRVIPSYTKTDISRLITNISEAWKRRSLFIECPPGICVRTRTEKLIEPRRSNRPRGDSSQLTAHGWPIFFQPFQRWLLSESFSYVNRLFLYPSFGFQLDRACRPFRKVRKDRRTGLINLLLGGRVVRAGDVYLDRSNDQRSPALVNRRYKDVRNRAVRIITRNQAQSNAS